MVKKILIGVCGLVFAAALAFPAHADQSIGYRYYYNEGVKAFKEHDYQQALRYFQIAYIYDPSDDDLNNYLLILSQKGVVLELPPSHLPPGESIGYKYYMSEGIKAYRSHDALKAIRYFTIALIYDPESKEADRYLRILSKPLVYVPAAQPQQAAIIVPVPVSAHVTQASEPYSPPVTQTIPAYSPSAQAQSPAFVPPPAIYVPAQNAKGPAAVFTLAQMTNNGQDKPKLQIEYHSFIIIEGKNIQRYLVVDEGYIGVKVIGRDRIEVDALKIGSTFLHIWDDNGRHTLYIEVVFPRSVTSAALQTANEVQHAQPFRFTYSNDWSTYYSGKNIPQLKRQSYDFNQALGVTGETPYGFFDASGDYTDFNAVSRIDTYTMGLSQIPVPGTSNFSLRGFDALRYLSPLTMPGTRLRGVFADVDLMDDMLGLSVSHGHQGFLPGFYTQSALNSPFYKSYIDAVKLTLFPKNDKDRYSFNFATGYGSDRRAISSNHVYSVEGQHKFNDFLTLNAEGASDSEHNASLAALRWQQGNFRTGLNFRDISRNYLTVASLPSNQGELGAAWTTDSEFRNFSESTFVEAYRDRLNPNPDHPSAYNYDANGHLRADIARDLWSDSDFNFVDTAGELSPRRSVGANQRISRSFGIWDNRRGTIFGGAGYQYSHSSDSDLSNYDREDVIAGIQLPLTDHVSTFTNYEYDWLNQPDPSGSTNPSVINAGMEYSKQFNPKFSITSQLEYRDELGVHGNENSFLSGQQSVIISSGFAYNPTPDVSFFGDGDASKVLSNIGNPSYDDFEVHVGMRITFGGASYWDPLGTVSGTVFKDKEGNGKYSSGDEGVEGVKVKVGDKIAVTDKNGRYHIQVRAKGVLVYPVLDTVPGGLLFSTPQSLNVQIIQGRKTQADFGLISQTGIYGIVFVDKTGTGIPNDLDQFIGKVRVILDGKIIQKSDSHGAFYFRQVSPGRHTVTIDINSIALDMVPLVKLDNKIDVTEGTNYLFNIPVRVKNADSQPK